jgi:DNA-binding transcriptional LysR family regulator
VINFNQLRVFYHAARCENYTLASKELCITQPAVTAQVKLFEDHCNLKLFKKKGRNIYLTDEGRALFEHAKRIFEYEKEIDDVIEEMLELKRGILRLGTTKAYARYFMPVMLSAFHRAYPQIKIHLDEGSSNDMTKSLLDFRNEIAIIAKADDHPDVFFAPFSQEELVILVSPDHPLAERGTVLFRELAKEPIIMKDTGSGTRKVVNELFDRYGLTPDVLMETSNSEFIKQLVQRGEGISFLVREAVAQELREGTLATVAIRGHKIFLDVSIAYLKDQHMSRPAKAFLDILGTLAPGDLSPRGIGALMAKMLAKRK